MAVLLLASCAAPQTVFRPVSVEVPVATPCKAAAVATPDYALAHVAATDSLFDKARAALVEIDQRKAYETALESQLTLCQ